VQLYFSSWPLRRLLVPNQTRRKGGSKNQVCTLCYSSYILQPFQQGSCVQLILSSSPTLSTAPLPSHQQRKATSNFQTAAWGSSKGWFLISLRLGPCQLANSSTQLRALNRGAPVSYRAHHTIYNFMSLVCVAPYSMNDPSCTCNRASR